jgi:hypothetical protein
MAQSQTQVTTDTANGQNAGESRPAMPVGTSTATSPGILENVHFSLFSNFKGPNVNDLGSAETVNGAGRTDSRQRMYFDSEAVGSYKLTETVGVGVVVPFWLISTKGLEFSLGDVGAKIYDKQTVATRDLTISTNLILQLPTNEFSKLSGMTLGVKTTPSIRYNVPQSRFTLGAWTEAKAYLGVTSDNGKLFKLWGAPYVSYQLGPKFSGVVQFEYEAGHFANSAALDFRTVQHDILTGVTYNINPQLMVEPYVAFYTTEKLSTNNAALGAIISASI